MRMFSLFFIIIIGTALTEHRNTRWGRDYGVWMEERRKQETTGEEKKSKEKHGGERAMKGRGGPTQASSASDWKPRSTVGGSYFLRQSGGKALLLWSMSTTGLYLTRGQPVIRSNIVVSFWNVLTPTTVDITSNVSAMPLSEESTVNNWLTLLTLANNKQASIC